MSNATFESPVAASQLFFAWTEQSEVGVAPPAPARKKPAAQSASTAQPPVATPTEPATPSVTTKAPPAQPQPQSRSEANSGHLRFTSDGRIAQPVRIGAVMFKLLKRYGITDAEIAEGVASYARKHQQAMAS